MSPVITVSVQMQDLTDLLNSALEGGSTYWARIIDRQVVGDPEYTSDVPAAGGFLVFATLENDEINRQRSWSLNAGDLVRGAEVMAARYPCHFASMLYETADAVTGDVFLQCCLFGELVFG